MTAESASTDTEPREKELYFRGHILANEAARMLMCRGGGGNWGRGRKLGQCVDELVVNMGCGCFSWWWDLGLCVADW